MKRTIFALLTLTTVAYAQFGAPVNASKDFVLTGDEAVGLLPPKVVCEYLPTSWAWSTDGKYIILVRTDPKITPAAIKRLIAGPTGDPQPIEKSIVVVDVAKGTSQTIWKTEEPHFQIGEVEWIADSPVAFITMEATKIDPETKDPVQTYRAVEVNAQTGKMQTVAESQVDEFMSVSLSPLRPLGLICFYKFDPATKSNSGTYMPIDAAGRLGQSKPMPVTGGLVRWTEDGARPMMEVGAKDDVTGKFLLKSYVLDIATGKAQVVAGLRYYDELKPKPQELYVDVTSAEVRTGESARTVQVSWLKSRTQSKHQAAMIGPEVGASISPTANAVMCIHQGIVTLRPLVRIPREMFEKALLAAEKAQILSDTKQCALGLIMLASDMDDTLPSNTGDWAGMMQPYLKNDSILSGFVYTFGGGNMAGIESPASTEIGYKPGPGGRAVAYADGHVKWIPDK